VVKLETTRDSHYVTRDVTKGLINRGRWQPWRHLRPS